MPRLSAQQRERAIGMLTAGVSMREAARRFNCSHSTIVRLSQRLAATGSTTDRRRTGQPRVTTSVQDQCIRRRHLRNRFLTAEETGRQVVGRRGLVSGQTVRRRLRDSGLKNRRPYVGPALTPGHRQRRLHWAQQHQRWTRRQWRTVVFSDESRFSLSNADGRERVWRRTGERYANCCVLEADRWGGGSVMVWGAFTYDHRTPLHFFDEPVNANTYQQVLQNHVVPLFRQQPELQFFQHDNARPHTARATTAFLNANNIAVLPWPSLSPDMAPIEHIWDELGRRVTRKRHPRTLQDLRRSLIQEWNQLPQVVFRNLVNSMRRRCQACIPGQTVDTCVTKAD